MRIQWPVFIVFCLGLWSGTLAADGRAQAGCGPIFVYGRGVPDASGRHFAIEMESGTSNARRVIVEGWHDGLRIRLESVVKLEAEVIEWNRAVRAPLRVKLRKDWAGVRKYKDLSKSWEWAPGAKTAGCEPEP